MKVTVTLNGVGTEMELDTGASFMLISESMYRKLWPVQLTPQLQETSVKLTTYTGEAVPILGAIEVTVAHNGQEKSLQLLVVHGDGPSLLGRDWLEVLRIDWPRLCSLSSTELWKPIVDRFADVFKNESGRIEGHKAKLYWKEGVQLKFFRPRSVHYSQKKKWIRN